MRYVFKNQDLQMFGHKINTIIFSYLKLWVAVARRNFKWVCGIEVVHIQCFNCSEVRSVQCCLYGIVHFCRDIAIIVQIAQTDRCILLTEIKVITDLVVMNSNKRDICTCIYKNVSLLKSYLTIYMV